MSRFRPLYVWSALAAAVAALLARRPRGAIDLRVYYENARHVFTQGASMYGPASGTGWAGGVYRYPPVFLYLFRPLSWLPLPAAVAVWAAAKIGCLGLVVTALCRRWGVRPGLWIAPAALLLLPYAIQELRYGNAQWLIVAAVIAAFLAMDERPAASGAWLGFATALKLWPLFFFPFLVVQRRWRAFSAAAMTAAAWTLLPATWLGWSGLAALGRQWWLQERGIGALNGVVGEIFYPGQSLHDVLMRYCAFIDYARTPDANYRQVNWFHLAPPTVEKIWWMALALLLAGALWLVRRRGDAGTAALFCLLLVVQPHIHRIIFVTLLWPALLASWWWFEGRLRGWANAAFLFAVGVAVLEPLVPGGASQRLFQVYGVDFWGVLLPLTAVTVRMAWPTRAGHLAEQAMPPRMEETRHLARACIVMPVVQEGPHLADLLAEVFAQAVRLPNHELWVLVVDGESTDGTAELLRELAGSYPRLRVLDCPRRGLGDAYQRGIAHALATLRPDMVLQMDGDEQHAPALLPELIATSARTGAVVIGSRFAPGAATPGLSARRRAGSRAANWIIQRVTGLPRLTDYTSGYRCLPAEVLARCRWRDLAPRGYAFQTALIAEILLSGTEVREIPMTFGHRRHGDSKLRPADYAEFVRNLGPLRSHCRAVKAAAAAAQRATAPGVPAP